MHGLEDLIAENTQEPLFQARLLAAFSALALVLAAIGIYGVLAYAVEQRTREIGVRMALGAKKVTVMQSVLRHTLGLAGLGMLIGAAGALAVTRVLTKFLFGVTPTDPATFAAVALLLAAVALAAGLIPAWRASRVDPLLALGRE